MAKNYVAGGYQDQARFHFFETLKLQRKQKLKAGKTGLIFIAGGHRSGTGFTARSLKEGLKIKDNADLANEKNSKCGSCSAIIFAHVGQYHSVKLHPITKNLLYFEVFNCANSVIRDIHIVIEELSCLL